MSCDEGGGEGRDVLSWVCCKKMGREKKKAVLLTTSSYLAVCFVAKELPSVCVSCVCVCACVGSVTLAVHPSHSEFKWLHSLGPFHTD